MTHLPMRRPHTAALGLTATLVTAIAGCASTPPAGGDPSRPAESAGPAVTSSRPSGGTDGVAGRGPIIVRTTVVSVTSGNIVNVTPVPGALASSQHQPHVPVRLLGIKTPELTPRSGRGPECGAAEATSYLASILPPGRVVTVEYDLGSERTDEAGRAQAYVVTSGGSDAGESVLKNGWGTVWYPQGAAVPSRISTYNSAIARSIHLRNGLRKLCPSPGPRSSSATPG